MERRLSEWTLRNAQVSTRVGLVLVVGVLFTFVVRLEGYLNSIDL